jgi:hypothetical protein
MRIESSVTAVSWIPSDAIEGMPKLPFELGVARYDQPPPDQLDEGDLDRLRAEDASARRITSAPGSTSRTEDRRPGYRARGSSARRRSTLGLGISIPGVAVRGLRPSPRSRRTPSASCRRSAAGRVPAPRRVTGSRSSGSSRRRVDDARAHDPRGRLLRSTTRRREHLPAALGLRPDGQLVAEVGTIDFKAWYASGRASRRRWGDEESDVRCPPPRVRSSARSRAS